MIQKRELIHQSVLLQAPYLFPELRFFFLLAGYAAGKTSALVDATLRMVDYFQGKLDSEGRQPKIGVCGITLTFLKKTFSGALIQAFKQSKTEYWYNKTENIIYVAGVELHLTPIIDEDAIFGYDWCAAVIDELDELPTYTAIGVVKALNDRCRQIIRECRTPFMVFATTSQGLKGTYQIIQDCKQKNLGYFIVRGRTKDNKYLSKEYIESMYKMYSTDKERECFLEGKFISVDSGLTYSDYDPSQNRITKTRPDSESLYKTVRPEEAIYIGQDFNSGFNKAVALVERGGYVYAVKNYSFPDIRRAPEVFRYDFPENRIYWIPDATAAEKINYFRQELRTNRIDIKYRKRNPLVKDRVFLVNKMFAVGVLFVDEDCKELDHALIIRQNDKKTGEPMKGQGEMAPDHICDALEYALTYMVSWMRVFKDLYSLTLGRRIQKRIDAGFEAIEDQSYQTTTSSYE